MSDMDAFEIMLVHADTSFQRLSRAEYMREYGDIIDYEPSPLATWVIRVLPGYRAHFEAEFDANGRAISVGQRESM